MTRQKRTVARRRAQNRIAAVSQLGPLTPTAPPPATQPARIAPAVFVVLLALLGVPLLLWLLL